MATKQEALKVLLATYTKLQKIYTENPEFQEDATAEDKALYEKVGAMYNKLQSKGTTDVVRGYQDISKESDGTLSKYAFAQKVLGANKDFVALMQQFANPDDPSSENFGATEKGQFSDIVLEFEAIPASTIRSKYKIPKDELPPKGAVMSEINVEGVWTSVRIFTGKREDIKDLDSDIRVLVVLNTDKTGREAEDWADPILTITHEIVIHAQSAAERIKRFKEEKQTIDEWKKAIEAATSESMGFSVEHLQIKNASNQLYEKINDETYRILDSKYSKMKYPEPNVFPPWHENATQSKNQNDSKIAEIIHQPIDEKFNILRQGERMTYSTPDEKEKVSEFIQEQELPRIQEIDKQQ